MQHCRKSLHLPSLSLGIWSLWKKRRCHELRQTTSSSEGETGESTTLLQSTRVSHQKPYCISWKSASRTHPFLASYQKRLQNTTSYCLFFSTTLKWHSAKNNIHSKLWSTILPGNIHAYKPYNSTYDQVLLPPTYAQSSLQLKIAGMPFCLDSCTHQLDTLNVLCQQTTTVTEVLSAQLWSICK